MWRAASQHLDQQSERCSLLYHVAAAPTAAELWRHTTRRACDTLQLRMTPPSAANDLKRQLSITHPSAATDSEASSSSVSTSVGLVLMRAATEASTGCRLAGAASVAALSSRSALSPPCRRVVKHQAQMHGAALTQPMHS